MKILTSLIRKKLENEEMMNRYVRREFSYMEHLSVYLHSLSYLGLDDKSLSKKRRLWKGFISSTGEAQLRYYKKLMNFKKEQDFIIARALKKIEEEKDKDYTYYEGSIYKPYMIGCLSDEIETEEE